MKRSLIAAVAAFVFGSFASVAQSQEVKIGSVDLTRTITEYYKFKEARNTLQDEAAKAQKEINEALAFGQKLRDSLGKLQQELQDPLLNDADKKKKIEQLQQKRQEGLQWDRDFQDLRQKRQKAIADRQGRMFNSIREEVLEKVREHAKASGYTFVFETSALGASSKVAGLGIPLVLHSAESVDFSEAVITALNKDAPAEGAGESDSEGAAE